jgi:hypothetical protein
MVKSKEYNDVLLPKCGFVWWMNRTLLRILLGAWKSEKKQGKMPGWLNTMKNYYVCTEPQGENQYMRKREILLATSVLWWTPFKTFRPKVQRCCRAGGPRK